MKTYKIFLASSAELLSDRREFSDLINYLNNENVRLHRGAQFQQVKWEWVDESVGKLRKQDDYNQLLQTCDLFVMLYWTKVGKYSEEEFDLAYQRLKGTRRLFVYKKTAPPPQPPSDADRQSLDAFEQKLLAPPAHFVGQYATAEGLKLSIQTELTRLFDDGGLTYAEMPMARCLSAGQPAVPAGFIGRTDELRTIRQRMDEGGTLMLINSEGGMGKTSIAAKYWADHLYRYKFNAWLFCENGIVEELKKLAPQLNLDLAQIPEKDHVAALRTALQNTPGDCLLVLDNANDAADIKAFRQTFAGLHWHVLLTSRCQHVLDKAQELPITHLPPPLAKDLFVSYYREATPDFEALLDRLLLAIGYNTLLIELFAKNLAELAALGETLAVFLKRLETEGLFLRERSFEVQTPYTAHVHKPAAATTDAIIEALYDLTGLAEADRLRLVNLALLPAESHLLTVLIELFAPDDKFAFRTQLASLSQKGWLSTDIQSYRLSPVVQKIVLEKNKATVWEDGKGLVENLTELLKPEQDKDNITTKIKWVNYAKPLLTYFDEHLSKSALSFQSNLAFVLWNLGGRANLLEAKVLLGKTIDIDIANFGETAPTVASSQSNLATVLRALGGEANLREAKDLLGKALANNIANFGETAPSVATSQSNLALVLKDLGGEANLREAKDLLGRALANAIATFGETAPSVAIRQSNLALVLKDLGGEANLLQAKDLLGKALANDIANFGETAPSVAISHSNLALVLQDLGGEANLLQAKDLLGKALANDIANFGETAPSVAISHSNLATVLKDLGGEANLREAKNLLGNALANDIANFGETAPIVAIRQSNLALVLQDLGGEANLLQAKNLLGNALANDIVNFGETAPIVALRQWNLATVLQDLGKREEACQLGLSAYWIFRNAFSEEYGDTQKVLRFLKAHCPECFSQP